MKAQQTEAKQGLSLQVEQGVGVVVFDQVDEPVNTLSPQTGAAFAALLDQAEKDPEIKSLVFLSGKKDSFVAGAKIDFLQTIKTAAEATATSRS